MSSELKHRRGTAAAHAGFIGAQGEITVKTDTNEIVVHDGVTPGGKTGGGYMPAGTGAVATTVQSKLRETVSVEDFGAGDGVTGDVVAFQNAIAASDHVIARGVYALSSGLTISRNNVMLDFSSARITYSGTDAFLTLNNDAKYCNIDIGSVTLSQDGANTAGVKLNKARFNKIRGLVTGTYNESNGNTSQNAIGCHIVASTANDHTYLNDIDLAYSYLGYPIYINNTHTTNLSLVNNFYGSIFLCKNGVRLKGASESNFRLSNYELWSPNFSFNAYMLESNASGVLSVGNTFELDRVEFHHQSNISYTASAGCIGNRFLIGQTVYDYFPFSDGNDLRVVESSADWSVVGLNNAISGGQFYDRNRIYTPEDFNAWTKSGDVAVIANSTSDPFGGTRADTISSAAGGINNYISRVVPSLSQADVRTMWTGSVWLRADAPQKVNLKIQTDAFSSAGGSKESSYQIGTEWRRFHVTEVFRAGSSSVQFNIYPTIAGSSIYAYGGMLGKGPIGAFLRGEDRVRADIDGGIATMKTLIGGRVGIVGGDTAIRLHASGTAAPTSGTWVRGDIVWNETPSAGGVPGWMCVTGGTPGTWKAMSSLSA